MSSAALIIKRYKIEAELEKCKNSCDGLKRMLDELEEEFDAHVKRYKRTHVAGAVVATFGATGR